MLNLDSITAAFKQTRVSPSGVSFAGKSLKLNSEDDAEQIVEAIKICKELQYLNLEGNTLGVDASRVIAGALEKHPELKRAQWKDLFTGRMKTEIPKALQYLGDSLVKAGARLTELDMSDNAFGPIGVEGLASLLRSSSCYALEELRLNNNGLGIGGGRLLAAALTDCYNFSKKGGKPLALKVFIAGRNRLENEGAKALAEVFKLIGTLEEIAMPQNGIYHVGIAALSDAFTKNINLQVLNLNDNTIGPKGAEAISKALLHLQKLKEINFGDCLLKTNGASLLAGALEGGHLNLEQLILGFNEIKLSGALELIKAIQNKSKLKYIILDGNQFGEEGRKEIKDQLIKIGKLNVLGSLEEDESEDSEEEDENDADSMELEDEESGEEVVEVHSSKQTSITLDEFLNVPSAQNYLALGASGPDLLVQRSMGKDDIDINFCIATLMKVSSLSNNTKIEVSESALKTSERLYKNLFSWSVEKNKIAEVNNTLLINLGLLKSENKMTKQSWNLDGCLHALCRIVQKNYVPESTKLSLKVFMQKEIDNNGHCLPIKKEILANFDL